MPSAKAALARVSASLSASARTRASVAVGSVTVSLEGLDQWEQATTDKYGWLAAEDLGAEERPAHPDIPDLIRYSVQRFARRLNKRIETIPTDTMAALRAYDWPGNIRELENAIERAVILTTGSALDVPVAEFRRADPTPPAAGTPSGTEGGPWRALTI